MGVMYSCYFQDSIYYFQYRESDFTLDNLEEYMGIMKIDNYFFKVIYCHHSPSF